MVWQLAGLLTPDAWIACLAARCKADSAAMEFVVAQDKTCRVLRIGYSANPAGSVRTHDMLVNTLQPLIEIHVISTRLERYTSLYSGCAS